jgi:hypothetical protein
MSFTRRDFVQTASVGAALGALGNITQAHAAGAQRSTGEAAKIIDLNNRVTFKQQLEENVGPVGLNLGSRHVEAKRPGVHSSDLQYNRDRP